MSSLSSRFVTSLRLRRHDEDLGRIQTVPPSFTCRWGGGWGTINHNLREREREREIEREREREDAHTHTRTNTHAHA